MALRLGAKRVCALANAMGAAANRPSPASFSFSSLSFSSSPSLTTRVFHNVSSPSLASPLLGLSSPLLPSSPLTSFPRANASNAPLSRAGKYKNFYYIGSPPYPLEFGLAPLFSAESLKSHYEHHVSLTKKLNDLIYYINWAYPEQRIEYERLGRLPLDKLVQVLAEDRQEAYLFNTASEVLTHDFFWKCLSPKSETRNLSSSLLDALDYQFGGLEGLQKKFTEEAKKIEGSGWVWLLYVAGGDMIITGMRNADSPYGFGPGYTPLLVLDMWEHSYCIDYGNDRNEYIDNFWKVINWDYVSMRYEDCVKEE